MFNIQYLNNEIGIVYVILNLRTGFFINGFTDNGNNLHESWP